MMTEELKAVWESLVEFAARHQDVEDNRAILAADAELDAMRKQRDELLAAAKAARDMILTYRDFTISGGGIFDDDSAAALADYDAVIAQIDATVEGGAS